MYDVDLIREAKYWLRCNGCVYSNGINFSYNEQDELIYTERNESHPFSIADEDLVTILCDAYNRGSEFITRYDADGFLNYVITFLISECVGDSVLDFCYTDMGDGDYIIKDSGDKRSYAIILSESNCVLFHSDKPGHTLFDMLSDMGRCVNTMGNSLLSVDAFVKLRDYLVGHCGPVEYLEETGHIVRVTYDDVLNYIVVTVDDHVKEILYNSGWTYRGYWWNLFRLMYVLEEQNGNLEELQSCPHGLRMRSLYSMLGVNSFNDEYDLFRDAVVEYDNSVGAVKTFNTLYGLYQDGVERMKCFDIEAEKVQVICFGGEYGDSCVMKDSLGVFVFSNLGLSIVDCFYEIIRILNSQDITYYVDSSGHEQELQIFN